AGHRRLRPLELTKQLAHGAGLDHVVRAVPGELLERPPQPHERHVISSRDSKVVGQETGRGAKTNRSRYERYVVSMRPPSMTVPAGAGVVARPMPLLAPVTTATLSVSLRSIGCPLWSPPYCQR